MCKGLDVGESIAAFLTEVGEEANSEKFAAACDSFDDGLFPTVFLSVVDLRSLGLL